MGFTTETGYSLPGGDLALTHARILHAGNIALVKAVTASAEASASYPASAVDNPLTRERWRPFANQLDDPAALNEAAWTPTNLTVGSDGQTLTETADTGEHDVSQAHTFTATEWIVAFRVARQTIPEIRIRANDGTSDFTCYFDLRDGSVGTASGCTGQMIGHGDGEYTCSIRMTTAAGTGVIELQGSNGSEAVSYAGDTGNSIYVLSGYAHPSAATLRLDTFAAAAGDMFGLAGHNFGEGGARITFEHDSNSDDTFTTIDSLSPSDNSPIMFLHSEITSARWQITVDRGVMPELAVLRVGKALQFEQALHQGHRPFETNRATQTRGNMAESGEWVGRSTVRNYLTGALDWQWLTPSWISANLNGRSGLIQALEREPIFIAWRPATYAVAHYAWTSGPVAGPVFNQKPNLSSFSLQLQAHGYE